MEQLAKFILSTAGLVWILCESSLFKKMREKVTERQNFHSVHDCGSRVFGKMLWLPRQLFKCPGCMGVWIGIINYFLLIVWKLDCVAYPLIAAISCYILVGYGKYLERKA